MKLANVVTANIAPYIVRQKRCSIGSQQPTVNKSKREIAFECCMESVLQKKRQVLEFVMDSQCTICYVLCVSIFVFIIHAV